MNRAPVDWGDRTLALVEVQLNGRALQDAVNSLKADRNIVLAAVQQNGLALQYAAEELKADREVVMAAVKNNGYALQYAAKPPKADRDIVLAAVQENAWALQYAAEELKDDVGIVLACVKSGVALRLLHASPRLIGDKYLMLLAQNAERPKRLKAFLAYARDLREANVKAKVDLWLTRHNDGELHHWIDATHILFKRRKRARQDETVPDYM
jgi:hypothetical protein